MTQIGPMKTDDEIKQKIRELEDDLERFPGLLNTEVITYFIDGLRWVLGDFDKKDAKRD